MPFAQLQNVRDFMDHHMRKETFSSVTTVIGGVAQTVPEDPDVSAFVLAFRFVRCVRGSQHSLHRTGSGGQTVMNPPNIVAVER